MQKLKVLDLFSGIGGFSLGLERTGGFETVAFCEINTFCRKVLNKHWPKVPIYEDVKTLTAEQLRADGIAIDAICGGFPCQDISTAGKGAGIDGERSGLWKEYARIIGELRPRFVIVENVAALLSRGLDRVLGDLASLGFDAEWHCIPASAVGAQHLRERVWVIAHSDIGDGRRNIVNRDISRSTSQAEGSEWQSNWKRVRTRHSDGFKNAPANTLRPRLQGRGGAGENGGYAAYLGSRIRSSELAEGFDRSYWGHQPLLGRGIHGLPNRVDRIEALGNAVVPQIPEMIGHAILASLKSESEAA